MTTPQLAVDVEKQWHAVFGPGGSAPAIGRDGWEHRVFYALKRYVVDAVRQGLGGIRASNEELLRLVYAHDPDAAASHAKADTVRILRSHWKGTVTQWGGTFSTKTAGLRFSIEIVEAEDVVVRVENDAGPVAAGEARLPGLGTLVPRESPAGAKDRGRALLIAWCGRGVREPAYERVLETFSIDELCAHAADVTDARRTGRALDISRLLLQADSHSSLAQSPDADSEEVSRTLGEWARAQFRKLDPRRRREAKELLREAKREGPSSWRWAALVVLLAGACVGVYYTYAYVSGLFRKVGYDHYESTFRTTTDGRLVATDSATGRESDPQTELRDPDTGARVSVSPGPTPSTVTVQADLSTLRERLIREHAAAGHTHGPEEVEVLTTWVTGTDIANQHETTFFLPKDDKNRFCPFIAAQSVAGRSNVVGFLVVPPMRMTLKDTMAASSSLAVDGDTPVKLAVDVVEGRMNVYLTRAAQELAPGDHHLLVTIKSPKYGDIAVRQTVRISLTTPPIVGSPTWEIPSAFIQKPPPAFSLDDAYRKQQRTSRIR
ncbi:MAG: hypothetical protein AABO58_01020 [Acidobacteriota bacterium]